MLFESEKIEYKSEFPADLYKEVIAFANTGGGTICLGVDDRGVAVGLEDVDETYTRVTNGIRDAIQPDVTMFIRYVLQPDRVIRIEVEEGSSKPYYLKGKGLKPSGVFVRQGASSVPASPEQIRQMIRDTDGTIFEEMRSAEQNLSFAEAAAAFSRYRVDFSEDKYAALGLRNLRDQQYTNLAVLLSDQCRHTTKIAVFADGSNTVFKDAREFGGSIFKQLEDSFQYLTLCNRTAASFCGLERIEKQDYPPEALREALLNALVHRDYGYSGSIIINVNDHAVEFISIGGLPQGLTEADIRSGISQPRNRNLAEVFHRLKLIEPYGTGIRRIFSLYQNCTEQPRIDVTPGTFKLTLPNQNTYDSGAAQISVIQSAQAVNITPQMKIVLEYLSKYSELCDEDLQRLLQIKRTRSYTLTKQMADAGLIKIVGRGEARRYRIENC